MIRRSILTLVTATTAISPLVAQNPAPGGPQFEVVSIKQNVSGPATGPPNIRPDGGFTMISVPIGVLIGRAYPGNVPADMIGLPEWAMRERYDVRTTSSLTSATAEDRAAMIRAMLVDRCKLAVHFEQRERDAYELVLARKDGKLGSGLVKSDTDCSQPLAAPPRGDLSAPPTPCTLRTIGAVLRKQGAELGDLLEGDAPIARLAEMLRTVLPGRQVVDRTGLTGSYRVTLNFNMMATLRPPAATASPDDSSSVFTAIQEQLGLKLQSTRVVRDTLVIDHIERPTPN